MATYRIDHSRRQVLERQLLDKAMPPGSLGALGPLAVRLAMLCDKPLERNALLLFAGDHGIWEEHVTHSPREITWQQCVNFANGGGACALFCRANGVALSVIDVGVDHRFGPDDRVVDRKVAYGTRNFLVEPAMDGRQCASAMQAGRDEVRRIRSEGFQAVTFGEMGVANTTSASALAAALGGLDVAEVTGTGSGISEAELAWKREVIARGVSRYGTRDPLLLLASLGGFEIAAIAGGILEAGALGIPVLLDGFIVTVAAMVACAVEPACKDWLVACHRSGMRGHDLLLRSLGLEPPLLDLGMQLGEGTGALVAWPIVSLASRILPQMTSFGEGGVTDSTSILSELGLVN
jgi:nicotinate-nucleotide--dimethylbenzimidazole phosphoribosyltransferase